MTDRTTHIHTSKVLSVRIDVEPKRVEHTSPERFDEPVLKMFISR